jgi:hypothetical protein
MDREVKNSYRQCLAEVGGILAPSARTGLAGLAPGVKVVQTVVCSTFTPGAKPAPRRVADGESMNPPRECAFAQIPGDHEHQGDENIKRRTRPQMTCPLRACEYELADTGHVSGRVLPGWCLVAPGDSLRA